MTSQKGELVFAVLKRLLEMSGVATLKEIQIIRDIQDALQPSAYRFPSVEVRSKLPEVENSDRRLQIKGFVSPKTLLVILDVLIQLRELIQTHWDEFPCPVQKKLESLAYAIIGLSSKDRSVNDRWASLLTRLSLSWASITLRRNLFVEYSDALNSLASLILERVECADPIHQSVAAMVGIPATEEEINSADELISQVFANDDKLSSLPSEKVWQHFDKAWAEATREAHNRWKESL